MLTKSAKVLKYAVCGLGSRVGAGRLFSELKVLKKRRPTNPAERRETLCVDDVAGKAHEGKMLQIASTVLSCARRSPYVGEVYVRRLDLR